MNYAADASGIFDLHPTSSTSSIEISSLRPRRVSVAKLPPRSGGQSLPAWEWIAAWATTTIGAAVASYGLWLAVAPLAQ